MESHVFFTAIAFLPGTMIWWFNEFNVANLVIAKTGFISDLSGHSLRMKMCSFPEAGATLYAVKCYYQRAGCPVDIPLLPRLGNHNLKKSKLKWHVPALEYSCRASLTTIVFRKYDLSWAKILPCWLTIAIDHYVIT